MDLLEFNRLRIAWLKAVLRKDEAEDQLRLLQAPLNFAAKNFAAAARECARLENEVLFAMSSDAYFCASWVLQVQQGIYWDYVDQVAKAEEDLLSAKTAAEIAVDDLLQCSDFFEHEVAQAQVR